MIKNYFKIAWRNLRKNRVYGMINVMGLAMSMACCILIFTLVKYHMGFDNFHKDGDRIYRFVTEQHRDEVSCVASVPPPFGNAFRTDYTFVSSLREKGMRDEAEMEDKMFDKERKCRPFSSGEGKEG